MFTTAKPIDGLLLPDFRTQRKVKVFLNANGNGAGGRCEVGGTLSRRIEHYRFWKSHSNSKQILILELDTPPLRAGLIASKFQRIYSSFWSRKSCFTK